jgi:chromosome segregation ATPase
MAQAAELQSRSTFGDEEVIAQQAYLASLGMTERQINDVIEASAQLSTATGMTLESAVKNLAKTYGGLTGELGESIPALKSLTAEQLKSGEAVKYILENYQGYAEAAAQSGAGSMRQLKNQLGDLAEQLQKYTIDEVKAVTATNKRKINARLQDIPNRIDETSRYIKPVDDTAEAVAEKIATVEREIEVKAAEYNAAKETGTATSGARILAERLKEYDDQTAAERVKLSSALADARRKAAEAEETEHAAYRDVYEKSIEITRAENADKSMREDADRMDRELTATRSEWQKVNSSTYDGATTCPTCGQDLPADKVAESRELFNAERARKLESITQRGKELAATLDESRKVIADNHVKIDTMCGERAALQKTFDEAKEALSVANENENVARADLFAFDRKTAADRAALVESLTSPENAPKTDGVAEAIKSALYTLKANRDELRANLDAIKRNGEYMERVKELETEQHGLAAEYERLDKMDYIVGEFVKAKAAMIEKHINALFGLVNFRLFSTQVNGAVVDECDITVNGVPYEALNNAMQINAGIDVISTFCRLTETYAPIWIDNCESVTKPLDTEAQQIRLYVSAEDRTIRYKNIF